MTSTPVLRGEEGSLATSGILLAIAGPTGPSGWSSSWHDRPGQMGAPGQGNRVEACSPTREYANRVFKREGIYEPPPQTKEEEEEEEKHLHDMRLTIHISVSMHKY